MTEDWYVFQIGNKQKLRYEFIIVFGEYDLIAPEIPSLLGDEAEYVDDHMLLSDALGGNVTILKKEASEGL